MEKHTQNAPSPKDMTDVSFEELAACQGIHPIADFDTLLGHPSRDDESADEFARMLREWRSDSNGHVQTK
jgi:hypothetical protein